MSHNPRHPISIVIVNFRSEQHLEKCIASIYKRVVPAVAPEILIINNDSGESLEKVKDGFPGIRIIDHRKNVGFGKANNIGAKNVGGEILLFLNPDTEILTENMADVLEKFQKDDSVGIIGAKLIDSLGDTQPWSAGFEKNFLDLVKNNIGFPKSRLIWESKEAMAADWVAGTALFIRRDLFDKLKGFDENIFMYFEDVDLCQRAKKTGKKIVYWPHFVVRHYSGQSSSARSIQKKCYYDAQEYYFSKHCGFWQFVAIKAIRKGFLKK